MEKPIITINDGKLQGTTLKSILGINYLAFKGIPYAQPPIGPLRFKEPQAPLKWSGIRDASKHSGDIAMQHQTYGPEPYDILGDEDCLYLNVYTKTIGHKRPVMFFIHGGVFLEGAGNDCIYREDYFVTLDIVLVCVNFRLGPMGFLNLGHEVAPGNQGLKDIILALKWVQENIAVFGGDPNNVTIFGHSSGSMTCHLFTLLPSTKGLFHKAILQSGSSFIVKNLLTKNNFKNGFKIASLLGINSDDPIKVIEFLRTVPAKKLIALEGHILSKWEKVVLSQLEYSPVCDADYTKDPLVPLPLTKLLKNDANIPIMIGHTTNECLLNFMGQFNDANYKFYNDNIQEIVKNITLSEPNKFEEVMLDIREFYLKNKPINKHTIWNLIDLLSDISIVAHNRKIVDIRNKYANANTYVYSFSYLGNEPTIYQFDQGPQPLAGVAHGDELSYMFYLSYMREDEYSEQVPREGTKDRIIVERLMRMWFNFAATGNPTPNTDDRYISTIWKPSTANSLNYLDIGDELTLRDDKDSKGRLFYDKFCQILFNVDSL